MRMKSHICALFLFLFVYFVSSSITSFSACTPDATSIIIAPEQWVEISLNTQQPINCFGIETSSDTDTESLFYQFQLTSGEDYIEESNYNFNVGINYLCNGTPATCQTSLPTDTDNLETNTNCTATTSLGYTDSTPSIPVVAGILDSTNAPITPNQTISYTFYYEWRDSECDLNKNRATQWWVWFLVGIAGVIVTAAIFGAGYYFFYKNRKSRAAIIYDQVND